MTATFELHYDQFDRWLKETILYTERDAADVVQQEAKLFTRDVAKLVPPTGNAPFTESFAAQRKAGMAAVEGDIHKGFVQIQEFKAKDEKLGAAVSKYVEAGDIEKLQTVLKRARLAIGVIDEPTVAIHNSIRTRRGRVVRRIPYFVMKAGSVAKFIRQKQKLVGTAKSGLAKAAAALGVSLPNWITAHNGAGIYHAQLTGSNPQITIGDTVGYIQDAGAKLQVIQRALNRRAESMKNRLNAMMGRRFKGYSK